MNDNVSKESSSGRLLTFITLVTFGFYVVAVLCDFARHYGY